MPFLRPCRRVPAALLSVLVALAACGGGADGGEGGAGRPAAAARTAGGAAPAGPAAAMLPAALEGDSASCPADGRWRQCSVVRRLRDAGLVPHRRPELARLPFLSAPGAVYDVHQVELRAFVYADVRTAEREALAIDPIRVAPRGETIAWPVRATLAHSGNLVAIILATNERQIERVQLALEAGRRSASRAPSSCPRRGRADRSLPGRRALAYAMACTFCTPTPKIVARRPRSVRNVTPPLPETHGSGYVGSATPAPSGGRRPPCPHPDPSASWLRSASRRARPRSVR
jgi:hypothetical protein